MSKPKLVCFDLDDTLIREIHSVMFPCVLNGKEEEHAEIQKLEENGVLDYIAADRRRAKLLCGLPECKISNMFSEILKPINNVTSVIKTLHDNNILSIVVTVGPKQVAKAAKEAWGLDGYFGSDYEVIDGMFTGKILDYIVADGKIVCLQKFCVKHNICSEDCIAVGDGSTDIPLFEYCGKSIAINYSPAVLGKATYYLRTNDLTDILQYII